MFQMTHQDIQKFAHQNQPAMLLVKQATDEYIAARCLLLNGLFPGLILAAQAVEKYIKGFILFQDNTINPKKYNHKFTKLFDEVKARNKEYPWDTFDELISRLYQHYQSRYPDNEDKSMRKSTAELNEIDSLVFALSQHMPVPEEVKFRSGLFVQMTSDNHFDEVNWATVKNYAVDLDRLMKESNALMKHLYGDSEN